MNNQSIELQVNLGLSSAKQQLNDFMQLAQKGLKPDSSGYKEVVKLIEQAGKSVDTLTGKMQSAFKTSSGAKSFGREYEKLLENLTLIQSKFGSIGIDNLNISEEQLKPLREAQEQLSALKQEMKALNDDKIGIGLMDSSTEFEKLRTAAQQLKIDLSNITFGDFGEKIKSALVKAEPEANKLQTQFDQITKIVNNFSGDNLVKIIDQLSNITGNGISKKIIDSKEIAQANQGLSELAKNLELSGQKFTVVTAKNGSNIDKFIADETIKIQAEYDKQIAAIQEKKIAVEQAISAIDSAKVAGNGVDRLGRKKGITETQISNLINSEQVQNALRLVNFDFQSKDYIDANIREKFSQIQQALKDGVASLTTDTTHFEELRNNVEQQIKSVFDGLGETTINQADEFIRKVNSILKSSGISLSDLGITKDQIKGAEYAEVLKTITDAIDVYIEKQRDAANSLKTTGGLDEATQKVKALQEAQQALNIVQAGASTRKSDTSAELEKQLGLVETLTNAIRQLTGMDVQIIDPSKIKQGSNAITELSDGLIKLENRQKALSNIQMAISRWMGFYQVLNLTKRAVNSMKQHITELDTVMTKIAVVTDMSQNDLWGQIGQYSQMARQYGVAIKGVYEISQLYYQQGLQKGDVMNLTQETLKMARIAGIEYSTAADYMTTAIRGFKLEMADAAHVTDVFSNLAANTASSTEELAVAISKTAASAASVGSSFESTSAMMATMIATTRESATNIGTALKSIISRYGEMKTNITGTDTEGEEYSLNKVDKALQSVGISIHNAAGQFRDFDDVILELAEAWDTIDKNTQRYIATVMAGNRQQSRFLALVSNVDEYKRALELANDSEGAGEIQTLKTLDSIDAKVERLKVTVQEFYTSSGIQDMYKALLDTITNVIDAANDMPKIFGKIPAAAISIGVQIVSTIKSVLTLIIAAISQTIGELRGQSTSWLTGLSNKIRESVSRGIKEGAQEGEAALKNVGKSTFGKGAALQMVGAGLKVAGSTLTLAAMNQYAQNTKIEQDTSSGTLMGLGALSGIAGSAVTGAAFGGLPGAIIGAFTGLITNLGSISSALQMLVPDATTRLKREYELANKNVETARQQASIDKGTVKDYESALAKFKSLEEASGASAEAMAEFIEYQNQLADSYPGLVDSLNEAGNSVISLTKLEEALAVARANSAQSTIDQTREEIEQQKTKSKLYTKLYKEVGEPKDQTFNTGFAGEILGINGSTFDGKVAIANEFKKWMSTEYPKANVDISNLSTMNYTRFVEQWQPYLNEFYTRLIESPLAFEDKERLGQIQERSRQDLISQYKQALQNAHEVDSSLKYSDLTGVTTLKDLDEIDNWTIEEVRSRMEYTKQKAADFSASVAKTIGNLGDLLLQETVDSKVRTAINQYTGLDAENLNKYAGFVSNLVHRQNTGKDEDWYNSTEGMQKVTEQVKNWKDWLIGYEDDAEWLLNKFDFSQISSTSNAKEEITSLFKEHNILDSNIINSYIDDYATYFSNLQSAYNNAIDKYLNFDNTGLSERQITNFQNLFNGKEKELTGGLTKQLQKQLQYYKKLFKNGQTLEAENYINSIFDFYFLIAQLKTDAEKNEVSDIIKEIDFSDVSNLTNIADTLREAGYDTLADELNNAAQKLGINVVAQAQSLSDALKDNIKGIEKVTEKIGKGMKYSDALEAAKEILSKASTDAKGIALMETDSQKGLLAYDKTLGEYVLTNTAIDTWINTLKNDQQDKVDQLERSNVQQSALYNSLLQQKMDLKQGQEETNIEYNKRTADWAKDQVNKLKQSGVKLTENEEKRYAGDVQNLITEFNNAQKENNDLTWKTFIENKQKLLDQNNLLEMQILESATKNSILSTISSYDFSSLMTGKGGQFSKENLRTLLQAAGVHLADDKGFDLFEPMYRQLLSGNFDLLDHMLTDVGGGLSAQVMDNAHAAMVSGYTDVLNYLNDPQNNPMTTAISAQIDLIKEIHPEVLAENGEVDNGQLKAFILTSLTNFSNWSWMSLAALQQAQADTFKTNQRQAGIGKTRAFSDAFKDNLTYDEITSLQKEWGISILNENNEIIDKLEQYYKQNEATGEYELQIPKDKSYGEVIQEIFQILGVTITKGSKIYRELVENESQKALQDLDAADIGKQAASVLSSIASASIGTRIDVSKLPPELQRTLGANAQQIAEITSEYERDSWILGLQANEISDIEWRNAVLQYQRQIVSKRNQQSSLQDIISKSIGVDQARAYATSIRHAEVEKWSDEDLQNWMKSRGYIWDAFSQEYKATSKALETINQDIDNAINSHASEETINSLQAQAKQLEYELERNPMRDVLTNLLSSYSNISDDTLAEFSAQFDKIDIDKYIIKDVQDNKKVNIGQLQEAIKKEYGEVSGAWMELFEQPLTELKDTYLSNITQATSFVTQGTSNYAEIQSFIQGAKELGMEISESVFQYDAILNAWTLDVTLLTEYIKTQAQELISLGVLTTSELESYINTNVQQSLARSIDIGSFLEAENKRATGKSYQTLKKSLVNYFKSSDVLLEKLREDYIESQVPKMAPQDVQGYIRSAIRGYASAETIADYYISQIKQGGINAVQIMRAVSEAQGNELNASDIEAAYRVEVSEIEEALDQLTYGVGSIISGKAVKILQDAGYELAYLDENNAVITGISDISAAYQAYYDALVESGEATLAAINEAKAKVLETKDNRGKEQSAIDALGDATGMTYTAFAEILSNAGIEMTDELIAQLEKDSVIKHVGGNKISIIDFSKFASAMGWDFNSEEYISAFKSYNDSLIEMNRKAEKDIVEEIIALKDAKPGDQLNVTQLWAALRTTADESILKNLQGQLNIYGASIKDGILTLSDSANLLEIARAIEQAAQDANLDLQDGLQEIADTIKEILQSYVEAIKKGIEGSLTNKEASELKSVAKQVGYNRDLRFVETAEGLKLAQDSAIGLYMALKDVDAMQASLVFDELNDSLKEANEHYQSISSILARIQEIEAQRSAGKSNQALEEELALAKEILAVRSTTEDEGFNFMSNKIPAAQNNPLNYVKNWTQALQGLRDAFKVKKGGKTGFLDYTDFYNIVTEMNNIAALGEPIQFGAYTLDGSLESAAALIEKGAASLEAVDTGDVMVNLGNIGFSMAQGGASMQEGVTKGIHSLAKSQISVLDSLIAVLEIIVAMEQLGDIAGEDMNIDLSDIFDITYNDDGAIQSINGFTDDFEIARKAILEKAAEGTELRKTLDHTKVKMGEQMRSMTDLLTMSASELFPDSLGPEGQRVAKESYQKMMNAFYQAAISGEYNLDNIADSVKKVLQASGVDLQDFVFEYTDEQGNVTRVFTYVGETMVDIDFTNDDIRKQVNDALNKNYKNADEYRVGVQAAIDAYKTGKTANSEPLTLEEKYNARTLIGLASNEFVLTNKDGTYTGTYQGQKFTGKRDDVLRAMAEAATYKDAGYDFTVETDISGNITVKGKTKIGKTEVEIVTDQSTGELQYKYKDKTYKSKDDIMGVLAEEGLIEDTGVYTFTDEGGKMHVTEVKQDSALSMVYTYYVDEEGKRHYKYNGQDFESYDAMRSYMELKNQYDPTGGKEHINKPGAGGNKEAYIEITEHAKIHYTLKADGSAIEPSYEIDGQAIDKKAFDAYVGAIAQEGVDISSTVEGLGDNEKIIEYVYDGVPIQVKINLTDGGTTYSFTGDDGFSVTSADESVVKAAIAAHKQMSGTTETVTQTAEITITEGVTVKFEIKDGKVTVGDTDTSGKKLSPEAKKAADEYAVKMQEELNKNPQTLENPVQAEATSVTITLAGNAQVTLEGDVKLSEAIENATGEVNTLTLTAKTIKGEGDSNQIDVNITQLPDLTLDANIDSVKSKIDEAVEYAQSKSAVQKIDVGSNTIPAEIISNQIKAQSSPASQNIAVGTNEVPGKVDSNVSYAASHPAKQSVTTSDNGSEVNEATGNIGLASGNAFAQGTLMGELGPELVVSNGRYFIAGQNGPEMVNLADDAIVFNHLQTKSLLEKGMSSGRGHAVTNERNAVSFATGNVHGGPAMASASAALAALKQLRAQWLSLASMGAKDLAGKGGGGGGGGGDAKPFIKELEKWYNWLQEIAQLEKEINYEEALRNRIASDFNPNGQKYYESQRRTLKDINREIATQQDLLESQQAYFEKRRAEMNSASNPFTALYTFDENGQLKYQPGALERLSQISGRNNEGKPYYTAEEQYKAIVAMNSKFAEFMKYDSSGNEIKPDDYTAMVQAFWDKIDADKEEEQSLHDSLEDLKTNIQNNLQKQNEILHEIEDNQISLENRVLEAIENAREREIDELKKQKDAIQEANDALLNGLNKALDKERTMYETQDSERDLETMRRRLGILQRTGGPASEIAALSQEIDNASRDLYFEKQQQQIEAIQEASDLQIEKLDHQIAIMEETLEYEKAHGLLWQQVYEVMAGTPEQITSFITTNNSEFWAESPLKSAQDTRDILFEAEKWKAFADQNGIAGNIQNLLTEIANEVVEERAKEKDAQTQQTAEAINDLGAEIPQQPAESNNSNTDNPWGWKSSSWVSDGADVGHHKQVVYNNGQTADKEIEPHVWVQSGGSYKCSVCKQAASHYSPISPTKKEEDSQVKNRAHGGYVNHGLYELGELGTETVLTAKQTKILRDNILSNRPNSLISLLHSYNEAYRGLPANVYDSISNTSNDTIIEHAEVNVNVAKLADNYDAAKAGDDIMQEMLNIARKTRAQNRIGR